MGEVIRSKRRKLINSRKRREGIEGTTAAAVVGEIILFFTGSIITSGVAHDLRGSAHVAVRRTPGNGGKCVHGQFLIHMHQLLFVQPPQCSCWFNRFSLACSRGDGADV